MIGRRRPDTADDLRRELAALREDVRALRDDQQRTAAQLLQAVQVAIDDEPGTRRRLAEARRTESYERAYTDPDPLVSIVIPTYENVRALKERSLPSALAQTHANVEVIVVGDAAPPTTAEAVASFGDDRLHYENLSRRGPYPDDREGLWFTAGIPPLNRAMELARGSWLAVLNDDDEFHPAFVASLLEVARDRRAEVAYGKLTYHEPDKEPWTLGAFPPSHHQFGWQMALQHHSLRLFEYELSAHLFSEPGDWNRARRMLRTGVRFAMLDEIVGDYWPYRLWEEVAE